MIKYLRERRYYIFFTFVLAALAMVPFSAHVAIELFLKPQSHENQSTLYQNLPKILSDLEDINSHPIFPAWTSNNNAEYLISKYVSFSGFEKLIRQNPRYDALKKIDKYYPDWRRSPSTIEAMMKDHELMTINTEWVSSLQKFDYWNFSTNTQIKEALAVVPNVSAMTRMEIFSQLPIPNYNVLRNWALVNFLQQTKKGHPIAGLKNYRKVAELINTSGTLIGNITAASMLKEEYVLVSKFHIQNWKTQPFYYIDTYTRVSWAWIGLLKLPMFDRLPQKFLRFAKPETGACAGSWETVSNYSAYLDFFQPQVVFESDFSKNVKFTSDLYKSLQTQCNLQSYGPFLSRSPASIDYTASYRMDASIYNVQKGTDYNYSIQDNWLYWPYVRRLVGFFSFNNGSSINYLVHYQTKKKKFAGQNFKTIY